jgi:GT2 family glycosyltransferase/glycosyltransferase involved in cell wall biosynthesis/SAM-dependent methyltransferase
METDPQAALPFTGERYVPELRGTIALEHLHRYAYACQFVKDKVVLDIACGEGYGSEMLARTAQKVYGVDIDNATIVHAKQRYRSKKLEFVEGSCEQIPLEDHSVDVVVSFETLEHTTKHSQTLREFKRVLKPRGLLIISSPEKEAYGASRPEQNPFHVKELDRCGFEKSLLVQFRHIKIVGQSVLSGSFITSSDIPLAFGPLFEFSKLPRQGTEAKGLPDPIYLIALCTDGDLPTVSASYCRQLFIESEEFQQMADAASVERVKLETITAERTEWAKKLEEELAGARRVQAEAVKDAEEKVKWAKSLEAELGKLRAAFAQEQKVVAERTEWAKKLEEELAGARRVQAEAVKDAEEKVKWAKKLQEELAAAQAGYRNLEKESQESAERTKKLETDLASEKQLAMERTLLVSRLEEDVEAARRSHERAAAEAQDLRAQLQEVLGSSCWRITAPLRSAVSMAKNSISAVRRYAISLLAWKSMKNGLSFDRYWYVREHEDVRRYRFGPFLHFLWHGMFEGRAPNRRFSKEAYLLLSPDMASYPHGPVVHYFLYGHREGELTNWLDRHVEANYGRDVRLRVSTLLDLLLTGEGCVESADFRKRKLDLLASRLAKAVAGRRKPASPVKVSVIIPVYNQVFYTVACVISLFESDPHNSFEVIIADDCSTDETHAIFSSLSPHIKVERTSGNLGFLRNCNHAARTAQGEYIILLNNDMIVLPNWLDELVETISCDENCGLVGSKLLNSDGTLQEAGGIYWSDGSAWNFGRGSDAMSSEYNYLKRVDYCSGASICLKKEIWDAMGGFDEKFTPAYCEEVDLSFRLRHERNLDSIYQPASVAIHLEGVSNGTDVSSGIKSYQLDNQEKIRERWGAVLATEHFPNASHVFLARDRSRHRPHMLFVDHYVPRSDHDAGSKQMDAYLRLFAKMGFQITFWPDNEHRCEYSAKYEQLGIEIIFNRGQGVDFSEWAKLHGRYLDIAFLSRPNVAVRYFDKLREHSSCRLIYYGHDLHAERIRRKQVLYPKDVDPDELNVWQKLEHECWQRADVVLHPSLEEAHHVEQCLPGVKTSVLPLYCIPKATADCRKTKTSFADRQKKILFVGGFGHEPNVDGILWFARDIFPRIRQRLPDWQLIIAGSNPPRSVLALQDSSCLVTGYISEEELEELYEKCRVAVAPLRFGAGVKGKVVEALLKGLPIVTTKVGIQGLRGCSKAIKVADTAKDFAQGVIDLAADAGQWEKFRSEGLDYFKTHFSEETVRQQISPWLSDAFTRPRGLQDSQGAAKIDILELDHQ